jgi:hypothetical protein
MKVRWLLYTVCPSIVTHEQRLCVGMGQTSVGPYVVGKAAEIFLDTLYE